MLVVVGASWGVIANTTYAASLSIKNVPLKEEYGRERLEAEKEVEAETHAVEVMKR